MKIHLIGIGGSGMSALAHLYLERGDSVTGSDTAESDVTRALGADGAFVATGHDPRRLGDPEVVVVSTAIEPDNPELVAARERGLKIISRGRAAAQLAAGRRLVAIAGTHGKTTTTTMVAAVLAELDPLVLSGGRLPGGAYNSRPGGGGIAVVEADESDGSFLELVPEIAVVTNVEADHLDRYRNLDEVARAFERFAGQVSGTLVAGVDDAGAAQLVAVTPTNTITYGFGPSAHIQAYDYEVTDGGCAFWVGSPWGDHQVHLPVPGRHNAANAMAAIGVAAALGRKPGQAMRALADVELPGRRMELVVEIGGARVYDDYGHHPTEVAATLRAAREICKGRLVCAFQPHRYTRLQAMLDQFGAAFKAADDVILVPVYGAGEPPIEGITSEALADSIRRHDADRPVTLLPSLDDLPAELIRRLHDGDVAVCMGAGDIYRASRRLTEAA